MQDLSYQRIIDDDLLDFMGKQESQFLIKPSSLYDDILARINQSEETIGDKLPWNKTEPYIRLRPGEVSLWAAVNGHGKSTILGQVAAWRLDKKWLIASMEMKPVDTMERMVKQISGTDNPTPDYIEKILTWSDKNLWIYDQTDTVKPERILALMRYAAHLGINHCVIDSLMKCGIKKKDSDSQVDFVDRLCWLAKSNNMHIHLVHHMRKGNDEFAILDKFDIRGAGELTDLVDNVFIIQRVKSDDDDNKPDTYLRIAKQRHFSWEGEFGLWFDRLSQQLTSKPHRTMSHWLNAKGNEYELERN